MVEAGNVYLGGVGVGDYPKHMATTDRADFWGKAPDEAPADMTDRQRLIFDTLAKAFLNIENSNEDRHQYVCFGADIYPGVIILDGQFSLDKIARAVDSALD